MHPYSPHLDFFDPPSADSPGGGERSKPEGLVHFHPCADDVIKRSAELKEDGLGGGEEEEALRMLKPKHLSVCEGERQTDTLA